MIPRRYLFVLLAFVIIVIGLLSHPTSREQLRQAKDYGVTAITSLTKGTPSHNQDDKHDDIPVDILPPEHLDPSAHAGVSSLTQDPQQTSVQEQGIGATHLAQEDTSSSHEDEENAAPADDPLWRGAKWMFEGDNELYPNPVIDIDTLKKYAPHNWKGHGQQTVAIFLATRNASMQDSYFLAAQQQVYRILWDPRSKSTRPLTVFVAPFVRKEQRDMLQAAGAYVREIQLVPWTPLYSLDSSPRWKDQFTKLNLWDQGDFSKILYLDTDAFPIQPFDALFDTVSESRMCNPDLLDEADRINVVEMCNYTFTATRDPRGMLNAGMFVITPNKAMHENLFRGMNRDREKYDNNIVEQGFLQYVYREDGPFPGQYVDRKWNAIENQPEDEGVTVILHEKLWIFYFMPDHWAVHYFNDTWMDMRELYQSPRFEQLRAADGLLQPIA
ncbi:hypothetical protein AMS68_000290 [Peltaster fructicola]|uniref:Glycosyltransferase family 8 protein n=1 Tax=Peltaster fructicola TaxID=286661 RepID=A0A6H0XJ69_9PEZI|nr:hypothetical protein AMS68_000290 [Peltaster fructicola]